MVHIVAKKAFTGHVLGVHFKDGHADTETAPAIAFFAQSEDYSIGDAKAKADGKQ